MSRFATQVSDALKDWKAYLEVTFPNVYDVFIGPKYVGAIKFPGISLQLARAQESAKVHSTNEIFIEIWLLKQGADINMYIEAIEELETIMESMEDRFDVTPTEPAENTAIEAGIQPAESGYTEWVMGTIKLNKMSSC